MLQLKNNTPFKAAISLFPNENGIDHLYVVIKGTFDICPQVAISEEQLPIFMEDEYWGDPEQSSLKAASELHLAKPNTDILMIGEASAPYGDPVSQLDVKLQVADQLKIARVFGDRFWKSGLIGLEKSEPALFESMPLIYERAYGGFHQYQDKKHQEPQVLVEECNPVGLGFKGKRKNNELKETLLPNIEDPKKLISKPSDQPAPTGFGPIAATWLPRKQFAGTYDEAWQKKRAPYLPDDFNSRFFNTASPDLICGGYLQGGEPVTIENMSEHGPLNFTLPQCELDLKIQVGGNMETPPLNLETVFFEPNQERFTVTWRAALMCDKKALKVEQVDVNLNRFHVE